MRATARFEFRYQYLAGGVNTGSGWSTWNQDGRFVTYYVEESIEHDMTPVFTYYMLQQSEPGGSGEADSIAVNLTTKSTMQDLFEDLELFFRRAGEFPNQTVVLHVEPDLWGYAQQASDSDDAATVRATVAATGRTDLDDLPDNLSGVARAIIRLRNTHAPNVVLAYHLSVWGTGIDIAYSDPSAKEIDNLATRAATFYRSLDAGFDIVFAEFSDRDSAFKEIVYGDGGVSWWTSGDFRRNVRFLGAFVRAAQRRVVMWQAPLGNTKMRAMNNTWNHFQDNRVQWLLGRKGRKHLRAYLRAGVVAFLFGRGANGATCACDAAGDGVTNPEPINGNSGKSLSADDDGGYLRARAARYYRVGLLRLP